MILQIFIFALMAFLLFILALFLISILVTGTLLGLSLLALSSKKAVAALIIIIGLIRINIDYSWPSDTITLEGRANPLC